jgi:pyridoxal phosphate enzyme (YggS family)
LERVAAAANAANRDPASIAILGASKKRSIAEIQQAYDAGIHCFGENYVADAIEKAAAAPKFDWHFIGHLQRNKVKRLLPHISTLHTLDTIRLADALQRHAEATLKVLIQVNVGDEATKSGCAVEEARALAAHVDGNCPALQLTGLMCIPPLAVDPAPFYARLAQLRESMQDTLGAALPTLSMGMSADLEPAIRCGATLVRIGTAIFGPRD